MEQQHLKKNRTKVSTMSDLSDSDSIMSNSELAGTISAPSDSESIEEYACSSPEQGSEECDNNGVYSKEGYF